MTTKVPFGEKRSDTAVLLLAAARELDLPPYVVQVNPLTQTFSVPDEVAERAKIGDDKTESEDKPPAKKAATKKAAAKKTAAKKAATDKKEGSK